MSWNCNFNYLHKDESCTYLIIYCNLNNIYKKRVIACNVKHIKVIVAFNCNFDELINIFYLELLCK